MENSDDCPLQRTFEIFGNLEGLKINPFPEMREIIGKNWIESRGAECYTGYAARVGVCAER
jgi:hypothetical protein